MYIQGKFKERSTKLRKGDTIHFDTYCHHVSILRGKKETPLKFPGGLEDVDLRGILESNTFEWFARLIATTHGYSIRVMPKKPKDKWVLRFKVMARKVSRK